MCSSNKISIEEIIFGVFGGILSYFLIVVLNIPNEDHYNFDVRLIF